MNSTMQLYFIDLADKHFPDAKDLASSLTPVSVNVGIALGSSLGGFAATNMKLVDVSWIGGLIAVAASLTTFISYILDRRTSSASDAVKPPGNLPCFYIRIQEISIVPVVIHFSYDI
ncbi:hypothetical protein [Cohnella terricola]|uniref:hypothetical protein n=1 Tax=Cohnella terricola TaxID=1289167 RepID=UPI001FE9C248|nr:hypothetical protein [Cohnella terricola]